MIDAFADLIPEQLLSRSGSVFYSGRAAFGVATPLYILGANPGGSPIAQAQETVGWHTEKVLHSEPHDWSAYRDESWMGALPGTWGMQPRVLHLLGRLGLSAGSVPASNVVFARSEGAAEIASEFTYLADLCWEFHVAVISRLGPRIVLCFGQSAGKYVRDRLGAHRLRGEFIERNNRRWASQSYESAQGIVVVVATHPSRANWCASASDPTELVREALNRDA